MPPRGRGRGRRRRARWVTEVPDVRYFLPQGVPAEGREVIYITVEELEAIRLIDVLGLDQSSAAFQMGISPRSFWNDLMNARRKIAIALTSGLGIRIEGGEYALRGEIRKE